MSIPVPTRYDAIVVGARCAGAATAMLLARRGARVLLIDRDRPGTDTLSTHAMMRGGVMQLAAWGLLDRLRRTGAPRINSTTFIYGDLEVPIEVRPAYGTDGLYAPRRHILDKLMADAAAEAGAELKYGVACVGLMWGAGDRVEGAWLRHGDADPVPVRADIVIGADGRRSTLARLVNSRTLFAGSHATATVYGYFDAVPANGYRWYFAPNAAGGIIPTHDGQSCLFLSARRDLFQSELRGQGVPGMQHFAETRLPELAARMACGRATVHPRAFAGQTGYVRQSAGSGWALVGDASYFKDPATAHGITDAFRDAEILANAIGRGDPPDYPRRRNALCTRLFRVTEDIASFDWTLDRLQQHHMELNKAMKANQAWIATNLHAVEAAA